MSDWVKVHYCGCIGDSEAHTDAGRTGVAWINLDRISILERQRCGEDWHTRVARGEREIAIVEPPEDLLAQLAPGRGDKDPLAGTREMIARRGGMISG